jgi:hypothetical protein
LDENTRFLENSARGLVLVVKENTTYMSKVKKGKEFNLADSVVLNKGNNCMMETIPVGYLFSMMIQKEFVMGFKDEM